MITSDDILNMNFYKKEKFTGSYLGMRYLIKKDSEPEDEGDTSEDAPRRDIFRATIWPGPYNFATTPDDQKATATFPFTPEGKQQVVASNSITLEKLPHFSIVTSSNICCKSVFSL